jgi:hypothetical protein
VNAAEWAALDEQEQEVELHEAWRIAGMCVLEPGEKVDDVPYDHDELVHALAVLSVERDRVIELEREG